AYDPPGSDEPVVPEALSGTFAGSRAGFFVCTTTVTSPVDTPDCFLGYVVPDGQIGQGRLRAVAGGFQRSSNFTVLEAVTAVDGTLSRNTSSEDVALYEAPRPVSCFAYFTGPAHGAWRMSQPHSAGHRRFEEPVPVPAATATSRPPGGPAS